MLKHAGLESFATDVVQEEKRSRAENCDVVDAVVHEIRAHGVVLVHRESDLQFRADAIDARDQNRLAHRGKTRAKQSAEAADFPEHLRTMRLPNERANAALQLVCQIDIHARTRIRFFHDHTL